MSITNSTGEVTYAELAERYDRLSKECTAAWKMLSNLEDQLLVEIPCNYCGVDKGWCVVRGTNRRSTLFHADRYNWMAKVRNEGVVW